MNAHPVDVKIDQLAGAIVDAALATHGPDHLLEAARVLQAQRRDSQDVRKLLRLVTLLNNYGSPSSATNGGRATRARGSTASARSSWVS